MKLWGAIPVSMSSSETYLALQRGIVDAVGLALPSATAAALYEVSNYGLIGNFMQPLGAGMCVNLNVWNKLPEDIQKIIVDAGQEFGITASEKYDVVEMDLLKNFTDAGVEIYYLPKEERPLWRKAIQPMYDDIIAEYGEPAVKVLNIIEREASK